MFDTQQKSTGRDRTATVSLFALAFILSPALLVVSRPMDPLWNALAIVSGAAGAALAFIGWKRSSELLIPSIANPGTAESK